MDDLDIAIQLMDRNEEGLQQLLDAHGGKVKGYLTKRYGGVLSYLEINEAIFIALLKVQNRIDSFDEEKGTLRNWFMRIAQRAALDLIGREEKFTADTVELERVSKLPAETVIIEDESVSQKKRKKALKDEIEKLPQLQKAVTKADMADENGKADAARLAALLGSTAVSVRVSRCNARKALKSALSPLFEEHARKRRT